MKKTMEIQVAQMANISEIVSEYGSRLTGFIRKRVKRLEDAEDIFQEVFYQLTEADRLMKPIDEMAGWLFTVARNRITDLYRKKKPELLPEFYTMSTMYYHRKKFMFIPLIIAAVFLFAYITMVLWNALLPEIFNLTTITFWQAAGLLILARLFFGFGHSNKWNRDSSHMSRDMRNKIKNMSPEEKKEFFRIMRYNREMWHRGCYGEKEQESQNKSSE